MLGDFSQEEPSVHLPVGMCLSGRWQRGTTGMRGSLCAFFLCLCLFVYPHESMCVCVFSTLLLSIYLYCEGPLSLSIVSIFPLSLTTYPSIYLENPSYLPVPPLFSQTPRPPLSAFTVPTFPLPSLLVSETSFSLSLCFFSFPITSALRTFPLHSHTSCSRLSFTPCLRHSYPSIYSASPCHFPGI